MYGYNDDKWSVMYEAMSHQLIDEMYQEEEELTDEDIEAIQLAREEAAYCDWLDRQEYDRCVSY